MYTFGKNLLLLINILILLLIFIYDDMIYLSSQQKSNCNTEKNMLTLTKEHGMLQCTRDMTEKRNRTSTIKWEEYMRDIGARTENVVITTLACPQPDISVQAKTGQKDLKGKLGRTTSQK